MIVEYKIQKHKQLGCYVVWCETKTEKKDDRKGYGCKGVFRGTKEECQEYLNKLKQS